MKTYPLWVYSPDKESKQPYLSKIINSDKKEECLNEGWYESPADFPEEPEEPEELEELEELEGTIYPDLEFFTKRSLVEFAKKEFDANLDIRLSRDNLLKKIRNLLAGNNEDDNGS